jgi:anti-sigma factor RsiW
MTTQERFIMDGTIEELTCMEAIELLMEYLDGRGDVAFRAAFEDHLALCRSCVNYLRSYQRTVELTREAFADGEEALVMPPELVQAILSARMAQLGHGGDGGMGDCGRTTEQA